MVLNFLSATKFRVDFHFWRVKDVWNLSVNDFSIVEGPLIWLMFFCPANLRGWENWSTSCSHTVQSFGGRTSHTCLSLWVPWAAWFYTCLPLVPHTWVPWAAWIYTCFPLVSHTCLPKLSRDFFEAWWMKCMHHRIEQQFLSTLGNQTRMSQQV